jgi:hypothetical protein
MTPEQEAYAIAEQCIAEAKARGARYLNLSPLHDSVDDDEYLIEPKLRHLTRIPPALAELTGLTRLDLDNTQVSDLAPLAGLTGLQTLDLNGTQVSDLAPLAGLAGLQTLTLDDTPVSDLAPLAGLARLQWLWLHGTQVSDLAPLAGLTRLQVLHPDRTPVSDLAPLAGLTGLDWLDLDGTPVSDLTPLKNLRALAQGAREGHGLSFADCPNIADPVLRVLAKKENPERTVETLAYLRGERAGSSASEQDTSPEESQSRLPRPEQVEAQTADAPSFSGDDPDRPITLDPSAFKDRVTDSELQRELHKALREAVADYLEACAPIGNDQYAPLRAEAALFGEALGGDPTEVSPGLLVIRGNNLRVRRDMDGKRKGARDPDGPPLPETIEGA